MILPALLLALMAQDTVPNLPPRARAMLATFPVPREGEVLVTTRFSKDSAWIGEQVELLTAAWFPEELRARLRRSPTLSAPSLSGLWSVQSQNLPVLAGTRRVGRQVYAVYVQFQTLFPLGSGRIEAPPAVLSYSVPTSSSFFAPEDRKTVASRAASLVVRPIPGSMVAAVGSGPTASDLRVTWLGPASPMRVGVPSMIELAISGNGNLVLWPEPEVEWPKGLRVYPERTVERYRPSGSAIGGEKHFRYTVVADSSGIFSLPRVRYPYFNPTSVAPESAEATSFALPVLPAAGGVQHPEPPVVTGVPGVPLATQVVEHGWPWLLLIVILPPGIWIWRRRRPRRRKRVAAPLSDPERELRALLNEPADSGPERVAAALRHRGVPRAEAEQLHRWLVAVARRRYGPAGGEALLAPGIVSDVLRRLRRSAATVMVLLLAAGTLQAQADEAARRYRAGDYDGAARRFEAVVASEPGAEDAWRDLGSARWMSGDDAGAATAWLRAMSLAPRDPFLRDAWQRNTSIPTDVRDLAPRIPLSRDELLLLALGCWVLAWVFWPTRHRRWGIALAVVAAASAGTAGMRWYRASQPIALMRSGMAYRVSPIPTAPELGSVPGWTVVEVAARRGAWVLAVMPDGRRGWIPVAGIAPLAPLD